MNAVGIQASGVMEPHMPLRARGRHGAYAVGVTMLDVSTRVALTLGENVGEEGWG